MMKHTKSVLAILLVACLMLALFAACKNEPTEQQSTPTSNTETETPKQDTPEKEPDQQPEKTQEPEEEPTEIVLALYDMRSRCNDYGEPIAEAANKLTKEAINVVGDFHWISPGDWSTKVEVALAAGDRFDVVNLNGWSKINKLYPQGLVMDITDYIDEFAPDAYNLTQEYINCYTFGGRIYGFPTIRNYCKNEYIVMRTDVLRELGLEEKAENLKSWSEYEEILKAVYDNYTVKDGSMYPVGLSTVATASDFVVTQDAFDTISLVDNLGDSNEVLYADNDGKVNFYQASDTYRFICEKNQDWFDKGYMWPDSALTSEFVDEVAKQGVLFSFISGSETGIKATKEANFGFEVTVVQVATGMIKTSQPIFTGVCLPVTCEEPEAALKWINMLYTSKDLMNLLVWGVEGSDWHEEDGQVVRDKQEGYLNVDFVLGNNTLLVPIMGNGADFYEIVLKTNEEAVKSRYMGFVIDTSDMSLIISQLSAAKDQYHKSLIYGNYTPERLEEYKSKLEIGGVNDYIAQVQDQLDAWLAETGR